MTSINPTVAMGWRRIPERYNLLGTHCGNCKQTFFPMRNLCPNCRRKGKLKDARLSGKGKIYSWTFVTSPPTGFELEAPYHMAIVELSEGPRIVAQLVESEEGKMKIGAPVQVVFRKIQEEGKEGQIHYGYKFRVV